jgi:hypothetical protein
MKYIDENRRICSIDEFTTPAHGSVNVVSVDQYIPEGYLGILDPLKMYQRDGIYGKRKILRAGNHEIMVRLTNRTSQSIDWEKGCCVAELRLLHIDKILADEETE